MAFVQIIEFSASDKETFESLLAEFMSATEGKRTARRSVLLADRANPGRYLNLVFFDSYESAMENSNLPETQEIAGRLMAALGDVSFRDLDVVSEQAL